MNRNSMFLTWTFIVGGSRPEEGLISAFEHVRTAPCPIPEKKLRENLGSHTTWRIFVPIVMTSSTLGQRVPSIVWKSELNKNSSE